MLNTFICKFNCLSHKISNYYFYILVAFDPWSAKGLEVFQSYVAGHSHVVRPWLQTNFIQMTCNLDMLSTYTFQHYIEKLAWIVADSLIPVQP